MPYWDWHSSLPYCRLTLTVHFVGSVFLHGRCALWSQGLREHVADGGELSALGALSAHVAEGQALFADCLAEAQNTAAMAHPADPRVATPPRTPPYTSSAVPALDGLGPTLGQYLGVSSGGMEVSRPGTSVCSWWGGAGSGLGSSGGSPNRRPGLGLGAGVGGGAAWDQLLRLGQLGLTQSEVARLEEIRRSWAARVIQRQVGGRVAEEEGFGAGRALLSAKGCRTGCWGVEVVRWIPGPSKGCTQ